MIFIPSTWFVLFASTYTANKLANFIYFVLETKCRDFEKVNYNIHGSLMVFRLVCFALAIFLIWDYPLLGPPELC